jgi:hypothetical protein
MDEKSKSPPYPAQERRDKDGAPFFMLPLERQRPHPWDEAVVLHGTLRFA